MESFLCQTTQLLKQDFVKIGILTQPIDHKTFRKAEGHEGFDQYVLEVNRKFVQLTGTATAVPLRYDLVEDKVRFMQTLNELDGVLFTGGMLPLRVPKDANEASKVYYLAAKHVVEYAIENKMPILAICQGFQLIQLIVADLNNEEYVALSGVKKEEVPVEKGTEPEQKLMRDVLLQDVKMFMQNRTTVWEIENPKDSKMFSEVSKSTLEQMST